MKSSRASDQLHGLSFDLAHEEAADSPWLLAANADADGAQVVGAVSSAERWMREVVAIVVS